MGDIVIQKIVRPERALAGPWLEVIASNLDYHRATFLWKCEGLSDEQLRLRPVRHGRVADRSGPGRRPGRAGAFVRSRPQPHPVTAPCHVETHAIPTRRRLT
ncbi:DUF664 domain-containing protein [Streptomyces sp. NPDC002932]|uniref:mycothiol transferase n=1 Tax=Streptomyces sp. NPDC002932 TaxID=3364672 RepID=UPI0036C71F6B